MTKINKINSRNLKYKLINNKWVMIMIIKIINLAKISQINLKSLNVF